jgi:hypothetical protein
MRINDVHLFVSDLQQVGGFLRVFLIQPTNKTDRHDKTEILLNVAFNTINQSNDRYLS